MLFQQGCLNVNHLILCHLHIQYIAVSDHEGYTAINKPEKRFIIETFVNPNIANSSIMVISRLEQLHTYYQLSMAIGLAYFLLYNTKIKDKDLYKE